MKEDKPKKKSLWEQMGRDVPPMTTEEMEIVKPTPEEKDEKKPKKKSLWEQTGRKPLW